MNARDRLLAYLRQAGLSTARAEANLDAFAHELAEQQRYAHNEVGGGCDLGVCHGDELPDLIDPQTSEGPVRPDEEPT
ncbi:hypothetical protein [Streptomyces sp. SCL15-4]|uniref:hypothetical protein n=1 Tax=Streptomyces sp. SCL15-4 TaxID=2967221 RepID=UPI002966AF83|nr:hypothetical protein [Streptomyces sp. SCL15-4]